MATEKKSVQSLDSLRQAAHRQIDELFATLEHVDDMPVDQVKLETGSHFDKTEREGIVHYGNSIGVSVKFAIPKVRPRAGKRFILIDRSMRRFTLAINSLEKIHAVAKQMIASGWVTPEELVDGIDQEQPFQTDRTIEEVSRLTNMQFTELPNPGIDEPPTNREEAVSYPRNVVLSTGDDAEIDVEQDGRFIVDVPGVPGAMAYGATLREATQNVIALLKEIREAAANALKEDESRE